MISDLTSVTLQGGEWISYLIAGGGSAGGSEGSAGGGGGWAHSPVNKVALEFKVSHSVYSVT